MTSYNHLFLLFLANIFSLTYYGQNNTVDSIQTIPKRDSVLYNNFIPVKLAEIEYNKKSISHLGFGKTTNVFLKDTNTLFAISFSTNRWWINKYFAGGWFYDMSPNKDGGYAIGPQITGFAEHDGFLLPYGTLASGFGYDVVDSKNNKLLKSKLYMPLILKIGGYLFFKKNRGFALFSEVNLHFNDENWPIYRIGIAWSSLKRN